MAIGMFDSGVGGLTVLKEIKKVLPNEQIYYFGDTLRVPYGEKSKEFLIKYAKKIISFLIEKKVDIIVVACNTISAVALEELQQMFEIPIIGLIEGGVKGALYTTETNKIGLIATSATVNSDRYEKAFEKEREGVKLYKKACPLLAPAAEEGIVKGRFVDIMLKGYIDDISDEIDTLILGCTHYPVFKDAIFKNYQNLKIVDPAIETAKNVYKIMETNNLIKNDKKIGGREEYFVTSSVERFKEVGEIILCKKINFPTLVEL